MAKVTGSSPVEPTAKTGLSASSRRGRPALTPKLTPTSDRAEDSHAVLVDVTHDEFHDPRDVATRLTLGETDTAELLLRERPHERGEVVRGHLEESERLVSRWQAEPAATTPIELVRDLPLEGEWFLANEYLLDPAARAGNALADMVGDVADGPPLAAAGEGPLFGGQRLQQPV